MLVAAIMHTKDGAGHFINDKQAVDFGINVTNLLRFPFWTCNVLR